ncbi:MAG: ImmA/IrrE family metallo-endopeptidase, partial [Clostridia bacterium]
RRVVAGHELGHIMLHGDYLKMGAMRDMDIYAATGKTEREANLCSADTLISDQDALEAIQDSDSDFFNAARTLYIPAPFFAFKLYSMVERGYAMQVPMELSNAFLRGKRR